MKCMLVLLTLLWLPMNVLGEKDELKRVGSLKPDSQHISMIALICSPEKYVGRSITTRGFLYVGELPTLETRLYLSSEDLRLLRDENGLSLSQDRLEFSYRFLQENRGSFVFVQAEVVRLSSAGRTEFVLKPNYVQVLQSSQ